MRNITAISYELSDLETRLQYEGDEFKHSRAFFYCTQLSDYLRYLVEKLEECLPTCHWCRDLIPYPYDRVKVGHSNSNQIKHRFCSLDCESEWRHDKWRNQDDK